ncbi:hypothetical protein F4679DRAFT_594101, partial [Xylaria curta]
QYPRASFVSTHWIDIVLASNDPASFPHSNLEIHLLEVQVAGKYMELVTRALDSAYLTIKAIASLPPTTLLSLPKSILLGSKSNQATPKMADNEQSPEPQPKPKATTSPRRRHRLRRQELYWDLPSLDFNLSARQLAAFLAMGVLLSYSTYLGYFSNNDNKYKAPSGTFVLPPITRGGIGDIDDSEIFSNKFLVELFLAVQVGVLYLWPFWNAFSKGTTFYGFVRSCASSAIASLVIYLSFQKVIQHYGLS